MQSGSISRLGTGWKVKHTPSHTQVHIDTHIHTHTQTLYVLRRWRQGLGPGEIYWSPHTCTRHSSVIFRCLISAWLRQEEISLSALCYCIQYCSKSHLHPDTHAHTQIHACIYTHTHWYTSKHIKGRKKKKVSHTHFNPIKDPLRCTVKCIHLQVQYISKSIRKRQVIYDVPSLLLAPGLKFDVCVRVCVCISVCVCVCVSPNQCSPINLSVSQWVYSNTRCASLFHIPSTILSLPQWTLGYYQ